MKKAQNSFFRKKLQEAGFSLVEVLTVLVVISVLAVLLVRVSVRMQERSMDAQCLQHLSKTGQALMHYLNEHNGNFLPTKFWYSRLSDAESPGMRDFLGFPQTDKSNSSIYLQDSIVTCPVLKARYAHKFPVMLNRCYSLNRYLVAKDLNSTGNANDPDNPGSPMHVMNIPSLSKMWAFTDGSSADPEGASEFGTVVSVKDVEQSNRLLYPHQEKQNVVFMDGHVKTLSKEEFQAPVSRRTFWGNLDFTD